jgi:uncharacterized protein YjbI with pentapeptide repeats
VYVTFEGVDFSVAPRDGIDFSEFEFGDCADFSQCKWRGGDWYQGRGVSPLGVFEPGRACFTGASFGERTSFTGAAFSDFASFTGVAFGGLASFKGATFGAYARFDGRASFGESASFEGAVLGYAAEFGAVEFHGSASFEDAAFDNVSFHRAIFGGITSFAGAAFGDRTSFLFAVFKDHVTFEGKSIEQWTRSFQLTQSIVRGWGPDAREALEKRHKESWKSNGSAPDRFLQILFASVRFYDDANFSGRFFQRAASFTYARFSRPPDFDVVTNASRIDFTGTQIGFVSRGKFDSDSEVPVRLRPLRKIAEETKNHDLERDLYIEERKAERGISLNITFDALKRAPIMEKPLIFVRLLSHGLWIIVMFGYWGLADYGRSFPRPLASLVLSVFIFHFGYALILAPLKQKVDPANKDYYDQAVWILALGNAVPFVGHLSIDAGIKKSLYCPDDVCGERAPIPPLGVQVLVIVQNVVSIALIFFFGLALRNYFKIK